jgi:hypothetical protein
MIYLPSASPTNTSFHGTTFRASANQLINLIGEITHHNNSGDGKVTMEWVRELSTADVFTIYDWKYYREIDMDEEIIWNIGGGNKIITEEAKEEIVKLMYP